MSAPTTPRPVEGFTTAGKAAAKAFAHQAEASDRADTAGRQAAAEARPIERLREPGPGVSLLDLKWTQCSYILGEPRDCQCFGERVKPGTAFCEHHRAILYRSAADIPKILMLPGERRKRRAA